MSKGRSTIDLGYDDWLVTARTGEPVILTNEKTGEGLFLTPHEAKVLGTYLHRAAEVSEGGEDG